MEESCSHANAETLGRAPLPVLDGVGEREARLVNELRRQAGAYTGHIEGSQRPVCVHWSVLLRRIGDEARTRHVFLPTESAIGLEKSFYEKGPSGFRYELEASQCPSGWRGRYERHQSVMCGKFTQPRSWSPSQSNMCHQAALCHSSAEYARVAARVAKTLPGAQIEGITRVQNLGLESNFQLEEAIAEAECVASGAPITKSLFHGPSDTTPADIVDGSVGYDPRRARQHSFWGPGAYFSKEASYANRFAHVRQDGARQILLNRVVLGSCFDYGPIIRPASSGPPYDVAAERQHHSLCGIADNSRVYAVFSSSQVSPTHIVTYRLE